MPDRIRFDYAAERIGHQQSGFDSEMGTHLRRTDESRLR